MIALHRRTLALLALGALVVGCRRDEERTRTVETTSAPGGSGSAAPSPTGVEDACLARRTAMLAKPELPGTPKLEARRAELFGRAKSEAIVFLREPRAADDLDKRFRFLGAGVTGPTPVIGVPRALATIKYFPEEARKLFLREGYLYADSPELAAVLVDQLRIGHLFKEKTVWIARGDEVFSVTKDDWVYKHDDGPWKGEEAQLLFGDRLGTSREEVEGGRLHRDLAPVSAKEAPDRLRIDRLVEGGAAASLRYGEVWVPAVLEEKGATLEVACKSIPTEHAAAVTKRRDENLLRARALASVRSAVRTMVVEKLRFDEPLKEEGQQDGSLRPLWKWAYDHGDRGYSFNGVGYAVFDLQGRPAPPQVCVDFVLDAYERASGTWWDREATERRRSKGAIDFEEMGIKNRRSAAELVKFANERQDVFEVWSPPDPERVPFGRRADFFAHLSQNTEHLHPGDIVVIHGLKSDGQMHYHSFLIDAVDPLTGVPFRLAGNAGRPRLQTWEGVMRAAPLRSIRHVVSPRTEFVARSMPKDGG